MHCSATHLDFEEWLSSDKKYSTRSVELDADTVEQADRAKSQLNGHFICQILTCSGEVHCYFVVGETLVAHSERPSETQLPAAAKEVVELAVSHIPTTGSAP